MAEGDWIYTAPTQVSGGVAFSDRTVIWGPYQGMMDRYKDRLIAQSPANDNPSRSIFDAVVSLFTGDKGKKAEEKAEGKTPAPASGATPPPPPPPPTPTSVHVPPTGPSERPAPALAAKAAQAQGSSPSSGGSEAGSGEGAHSGAPAGLQHVVANLPSQKSTFGQGLAVSNTTHSMIAAGQTVALTVAVAPAVIATAPELVPAVTGLLGASAGYRAAGGAVAGALTQGIQGNDASSVAQGAAIGGVVGLLNPAALVGLSPGALAGAFNAGLGNAGKQGVNMANGEEFSWPSLGASLVSGFVLGGVAGPTMQKAADVIPLQSQLMGGVASGSAGGLLQGAAKHGVP